MITSIIYLVIASLGIGFFVYLRRTGKKEAIGEIAKETISTIEEANRIDNTVNRYGDGTVHDELLRDWTKK